MKMVEVGAGLSAINVLQVKLPPSPDVCPVLAKHCTSATTKAPLRSGALVGAPAPLSTPAAMSPQAAVSAQAPLWSHLCTWALLGSMTPLSLLAPMRFLAALRRHTLLWSADVNGCSLMLSYMHQGSVVPGGLSGVRGFSGFRGGQWCQGFPVVP